MLTVRCPNTRDKFFGISVCNQFLGQIDNLNDKTVIFSCNACRKFFKLIIKDKRPVLTLIDKKDMNFKQRLGYEVGGYQIVI